MTIVLGIISILTNESRAILFIGIYATGTIIMLAQSRFIK